MVDGFPFGTTYNGATPGTLVDFDDNGYFKLVTGFSNGILMSNLRRPVSDLTPWTTYRGSLGRSGSFVATAFVANDDALQVPTALRLGQNYPNPFNPHTTITFALGKDAATSLSIFNTRGQKVRTLVNAPLTMGSHSITWDGRDDSGRALASGLYFYRLSSDGKAQTKKMLLMK